MSTEKEQRVVQMQFDNKQFEAGVSATLKSIDELNKTLELTNSTKAFSGLQNGISKLDLSPIASGVESIADKFTLLGMTGVKILDEISDKAIAVGKNLWNQTIGQIQSGGKQRALNIANAQFKMKGLGVDWEQAYQDMDYAVSGTAYGIDEAANAAAQFAASGVELGDDMKDALRGISGVAAMTNAQFSEIASVFTAAAGKGKVQAMELNRIALRGVNAYATLANYMGVTEADIHDMVSKGEIDFQTFAAAMNDAFGEHATKANETFTGSLANMRAALSRIGEIFYTPILDSYIGVFNKLKNAIDNVKNAMKPAEEGGEAFSTKFDRMAHLISDVTVLLIERFAPGVDAIREKLEPVNRALDKANGFLTDFKSYLGLTSKEEKEAVDGASALGDELDRITAADKKIALDIWNFSDPYGNGQQRIDMLGDSYDRVQEYINTFIETGYDVAKTDELLGISAEEAAISTESLNEALAKGTDVFKARSFEKLGKIFSNISTAASNISYTVVGTVKALFGAFGDVFSIGQAADDLVSFSSVLVKVTEYFKPTEKTLENIRKTFKGVIAVFDIFYQAIRAVVRGVGNLLGPLLGKTEGFGGSLLEVTGTIGEFIFNIDKAIKEGNLFGKLFDKIVGVVKEAPTYFKKATSVIKEFASQGLDTLSEKTGIDIKGKLKGIADGVKNAAKAFLEWSGIDIHGIVDSLKEWGKALWEAIKTGDYKKALAMLWDGIKTVFGGIAHGIANIGKLIKDALLASPLGPTINKFLGVLTKLKDKVLEIIGQIFGNGKKTVSGQREIGAAGNSHVVKAVKNETSALEKVKYALLTVWEGVKTIFKGAVNFLVKAGGAFWDALKSFVRNLSDTFKEAGFESIKDVFAWVELNYLLNALYNFSKISKGLGKVLNSISGYINAKKWGVYVGFFKTIAKSMLMIAASIAIVAITFEMMPRSAFGSFLIIEFLLLQFAVIAKLIGAISKEYGEIKIGQAAAIISAMGYAILEIALAFSLMAKSANKYGWEASLMAIGTIGSVMIGVVFLLRQMSSFVGSNEFSGKAITKAGKAMQSVAMALIMSAAAFAIIAKVAAKSPSGATQAWAVLVTMFAGMYGFLYAVSVIASNTGVSGAKVASAVMAVGGAILALGLALDLMTPAILIIGALPVENAAQGVGYMLIMIAGLATAIGLMSSKKLNLSTKKMMAAAGAIAIVATSLSGLIPAIVILGKMPLDKVGMGMLEVFGGLSMIVLAIIGVTHAANGGPAGMMAAAGSIAIIAASLVLLAPAVAMMGALPLAVLAKGLGSLALFLLALAGISHLVQPVGLVALAGAVLLLGLSVLSIAQAFWIATKAVIAAAAAWKLIEGMGAKIGHEVGQALAAIADEIIKNAGKISFAAGVLVAAVIAALINSVLAFIPALAEALITLISEILKVLDEHAFDIAEHLGSIAVKIGIGIVTGVVNGIMEELGATRAELKEAGEAWIHDLFSDTDYFEEYYKKNSSSAADAEKLRLEARDKVFNEHIDARIAKQKELEEKYGASWQTMATAQELAEATMTEAEAAYLEERSQKAKEELDAFIQAEDEAIAAHHDAMNGAYDEQINIASSKGEEQGKQYGEGLVRGLSEKQAEIKAQVENGSMSMFTAFRTFWQIKSPSKVMEKNGEYIMEGLVDGLDEARPDIDKATERCGTTIKDAFSDSTEDAFSDFSIMDTLEDADAEELTITPVWDQSKLDEGIDDINGITSDFKVGGLSSKGFDLSSFVNDKGNLSFDMANMDGLLNGLNLDTHFGNLENSNYNLAGAIDGLTGSIYDMNNKDTVIENVINLDGYNIAAATAPYSDSIMGDRQAAVDRGMSPIEYQARVARNGYTAGNVYDAGIINTNPNNRSGLGYGLSTARNIISKTYRR